MAKHSASKTMAILHKILGKSKSKRAIINLKNAIKSVAKKMKKAKK
jgi:hypothetical protein